MKCIGGQQWADADLFNLAQVHIKLSEALKRELVKVNEENSRLRMNIEKLGQLGDFGSANDPATGVVGSGPEEPIFLTFASGPLMC